MFGGLSFSLLFWLFGRCFFGRGFSGSFFLWLILAELFRVTDLAGLIGSDGLDPSRELNLLLSQDTYYTRSRTGTILEVEFYFFFVQSNVFGVWVEVTNIGNNAATARVAARFLNS